jgi:hypothetical protein
MIDGLNNYAEHRIGYLEQKVNNLEFRVNILETQRNLDYVISLLEKNDKLFDKLGEIGAEFDEILTQSLTEPSEKR